MLNYLSIILYIVQSTIVRN